MEIIEAARAVRARWRLVAAVALVAAAASLAAALAQPARYGSSARLLVTIGDVARVDIEDPLAYDVPAIVRGQPFAQDVAAALARQGVQATPGQVASALSATNQKREVTLSAAAGEPAQAEAILTAAVAQLQAGGLRYWGAAAGAAAQRGLSVVVLDPPSPAVRLNGPAAVAREVALRAVAGLAAGCLLALALEIFGARRA